VNPHAPTATAERLRDLAERIMQSATLDPADRRIIAAALETIARWLDAR
jgi:hypothetical protein